MLYLDSGQTLQLLQISDTHLSEQADAHLLGINTQQSLQAVLAMMAAEQHDPAAILVTGDLSQDDSLASYCYLQQALTRFTCPAFWLNGNHDNAAAMQQVAANTPALQQVVRSTYWQVILLNSQVEGAVLGYLDAMQLQLLDQALQQRPDLHTLICLHHHPVPMGSAWIDNIGLQNADALTAVIASYPQVRAVLWGHVHQESDRSINGVRYLSSPSTCVQFLPCSADFAVDQLAPGYRWLNLHADGSIDTGVSRVAAGVFTADLAAGGY
ncbi:3',5'-cyclic-AMP phosphodiesterase [Alishewanella sp. d11]|uniref:3',5'-cyclic-AMP phosphodiesterase n=1 Tax=Alishewanella sp. d11 TaxID=3414030 RepID=UPI003BF7C06E